MRRDDYCYICDSQLHAFMLTPILKLPNDDLAQCCEKCADREFPNWREDD